MDLTLLSESRFWANSCLLCTVGLGKLLFGYHRRSNHHRIGWHHTHLHLRTHLHNIWLALLVHHLHLVVRHIGHVCTSLHCHHLCHELLLLVTNLRSHTWRHHLLLLLLSKHSLLTLSHHVRHEHLLRGRRLLSVFWLILLHI